MNLEIKLLDGSKVEALIGEHKIIADQDKASGGDNTAPNPFEYFLASVGMCVGFYIKGFCKNRGINMDGIKITEEVTRNSDDKVKFSISIKLPSDFPEKYKSAMVNVASQCAVKKAILNTPEFELKLV